MTGRFMAYPDGTDAITQPAGCHVAEALGPLSC